MAVNFNSDTEGYDFGTSNLCGGQTELTVAVTVNQSGAGANNDRFACQWATVNGAYNQDYSWLLQNNTNYLRFVINNEGGTATGSFRGERTTSQVLAASGLKRMVGAFEAAGDTIGIWLNGNAQSTTSSFSANITSINSQTLNVPVTCGYDGQGQPPAYGDYSEFAVWSIRLPDAACAAISAGVSPRLFPIGRIFYAPLINTSWPHDMHGRTGSANGTPTDAAHERFFYPRRRFINDAGRTYSFVDDSLVRDRMVPGGAYVNEDGAGLVHRQIPGSAYLNEGAVTTRTAQQGQSPGGPYVQYTR